MKQRFIVFLQFFFYLCIVVSCSLQDVDVDENNGILLGSIDTGHIAGWNGNDEVIIDGNDGLYIFSVSTKSKLLLDASDTVMVGAIAKNFIYYQYNFNFWKEARPVYRIQAVAGSVPERILDMAFSFTVSSNGNLIAYFETDKSDSIMVYEISSGVRRAIAVPQGEWGTVLRFSGDNDEILFLNYPSGKRYIPEARAFIANLNSGLDPVFVVKAVNAPLRLESLVDVKGVLWTADGFQQLDLVTENFIQKVRIKNFSTGSIQYLGEISSSIERQAWSSDGKKMVYWTHKCYRDDGGLLTSGSCVEGVQKLWIMDMTSMEHYQIGENYNNWAAGDQQTFSSDGSIIAYTYSRNKNSYYSKKIYIANTAQ